jgi:putative ABC transport system permease protein
VVGQISLSLVLLAASLLFVRSLRNLTTLDAGLRQDGLLIMGADITRLNYTAERRALVFRNLLDQVRNTPGVDSVAAASIVPLSGEGWNDMIDIPGVVQKDHLLSWFNSVSGGYFQTLGATMVGGRDFDEHDTTSAPEVAIVNQEFRRKFLAGANPIGKQIRLVNGPGEPEHQYQVVGMVKDFKYQSLREDARPVVYVAGSQSKGAGQGIRLLVRSRLAIGTLIAALKNAAEQTNPEMSIQFRAFQSQVQDSLLRDRLMATLSSFFGFLATALATVGLYGVISYMVARRRGEIGIRMALGATRSGVLRLILKEAGVLLAVGLAVGAVLAMTTGKAAETLLFGLKPSDPFTIVVAVLLLAAVAMVASFVPALCAARTEPMAALREE